MYREVISTTQNKVKSSTVAEQFFGTIFCRQFMCVRNSLKFPLVFIFQNKIRCNVPYSLHIRQDVPISKKLISTRCVSFSELWFFFIIKTFQIIDNFTRFTKFTHLYMSEIYRTTISIHQL